MYPLLILIMVASAAVQWRLRSKFKEYGQVGLRANLSGREVAAKMLADHGIYDVQIISTEGSLSDHYNPTDKTVNLSTDVYPRVWPRCAARASLQLSKVSLGYGASTIVRV
jgi:Zn-dependent membrane protease YugP